MKLSLKMKVYLVDMEYYVVAASAGDAIEFLCEHIGEDPESYRDVKIQEIPGDKVIGVCFEDEDCVPLQLRSRWVDPDTSVRETASEWAIIMDEGVFGEPEY